MSSMALSFRRNDNVGYMGGCFGLLFMYTEWFR